MIFLDSRFLDVRAYLIAYLITSFFGLCIGSFLNVCIYRIPKGESLVKRSSHCMTCGTKIRFYDLVPVFSWLFLKGKCRGCGEKISGRYPLVESLNCVLYLLVLTFVDVFTYPVHGLITAISFSLLIVIGFIDYDTMEIYGSHLVMLAVLAVLSAIFTDVLTIPERLIGAVCISVPFFIIGEVSTIYTKKKYGERIRGIELGDTLLMLCSGLLIGTKCIVASAFIGIFTAAVVGVIGKIRGKESKISFGPYLAIGIVFGTLWGNQIINWYMSLFTYPQM